MRQIRLDPAGVPHDVARYITLRPRAGLVEVVLDRDGLVYRATSEAGDGNGELRHGFAAALDEYGDAAVDYLSTQTSAGWATWSNGPSYVQIVAPFHLADRAAEALQSAEMDGDFTGLENLTAEMRAAVPLEQWLAPGERQLRQGLDFDVAPGAFVQFLRREAVRRGLRLNGRAEPGAVWVRPTVTRAHAESYAEWAPMNPMWVDPAPYLEHVEPDDAPVRPYLETWNDDAPAAVAEPVAFVPVVLAEDEGRRGGHGGNRVDCVCGYQGHEDGAQHARQHMDWSVGFRVPKNLFWPGDERVALVTETSPKAWRRLAYEVAKLPRRENHYDFASFSVGDGLRDPDANGLRAYLMAREGRVVGFCSVRDVDHPRWYPFDGQPAEGPLEPQPRTGDGSVRPIADVVWTAQTWRRRGIARRLIEAIATDNDVDITDVAWSTPFSDGGQALARSINGDGTWLG